MKKIYNLIKIASYQAILAFAELTSPTIQEIADPGILLDLKGS